MEEDVAYYIMTYNVCQHIKVHQYKEYRLLHPLPVPTQPFEVVTIDFITGLPCLTWNNNEYDAVLVLVCLLTKYVIYILTHKDLTVEGLA